MGTLGSLTLLDSVHVSCAADEPYEDLVQTAFGEPYYLEPFGSEGYFAEVKVDNVSGINVDIRRYMPTIGGYFVVYIGSLAFYSYGSVADTLPAQPQCYEVLSVNANKGYAHLNALVKLNNFSLHHKVENGIYSGEMAGYTISTALGTWTAAQSTLMQILITKIPGISYDFKKLVAHTENVKFDALPARKNGKDGIAIFINDRLEKFIVV